ARSRQKVDSLDDLVDAGEDRGRDLQTQRISGFAVDDELELRRLLDRQIGRLGALEDAADEVGGAAIGFLEARAIGKERTAVRHYGPTRNQREAMLDREIDDGVAVLDDKTFGEGDERLRRGRRDGIQGSIEFRAIGRREKRNVNAELLCLCP